MHQRWPALEFLARNNCTRGNKPRRHFDFWDSIKCALLLDFAYPVVERIEFSNQLKVEIASASKNYLEVGFSELNRNETVVGMIEPTILVL